MNDNEITEDIIRLSDERNTWSSTLCIPVSDFAEFLDISSAAKGYNSSIPPGATDQPDTFLTGKGLISFYHFNPEIFNLSDRSNSGIGATRYNLGITIIFSRSHVVTMELDRTSPEKSSPQKDSHASSKAGGIPPTKMGEERERTS